MSYPATLEPQLTENVTQLVAVTAKIDTATVGNTALPTFVTNSANLGSFCLTEVWLHADAVSSGNSYTISVGTNSPTYNNLCAGTSWTTNVTRFVQLPIVAGASTNAPVVVSGGTVFARVSTASASASTATVVLVGFYTGVR